jgi:hypothetical protein
MFELSKVEQIATQLPSLLQIFAGEPNLLPPSNVDVAILSEVTPTEEVVKPLGFRGCPELPCPDDPNPREPNPHR